MLIYHSLLYIFHSLFSDSSVFISSLITVGFWFASFLTRTQMKTQLLRLSVYHALKSRAPSELCRKPLATNPDAHMCALPIAPVPVRKVHVGPDNKRTLAAWKRTAIMSHWGGTGRRGSIFYVTAVGWWQQNQIGEEAPAARRLKSICTVLWAGNWLLLINLQKNTEEHLRQGNFFKKWTTTSLLNVLESVWWWGPIK